MISNAGISRCGRVRKKSAKLIEMEDWDSGDGENKSRKKSKSLDDSDQDTERKVAPIRIPKPPFSLTTQKKKNENLTMNKVLPVKIISRDGAPIEVKSSTSYSMNIPSTSPVYTSKMSEMSSSSSETSDSSSDDSDSDIGFPRSGFQIGMSPHDISKKSPMQHMMSKQVPQKKVEVEKVNTFSGNEGSSEFTASLDESEGDTNDHSLIIADAVPKKKKFITKQKRDNKEKLKKTKKSKLSEVEDEPYEPVVKKIEKKPRKKDTKGKKNDSKPNRPLTAYMLWCQENRKKIVAQQPDMDFAQISKKLGEVWKLMPEKEKMAWKRKAQKAAHKGSTLISTGRPTNSHSNKLLSKTHAINNDKIDDIRNLSQEGFRAIGTSVLDVAAHLKLLGESLSIIGQRLTEHEGQIAVSGSLSVLLDSTLCALGPLLCLTSQAEELNGCSQETLCQILDNVAYIMPGL